MKDETFNRFMNIRFVIPIKIIIGSFLALLVNPKGSPEFNQLIADCITYSIVTCMLYFAGDYVFYITPKIVRWIISKFTNKTEIPQ